MKRILAIFAGLLALPAVAMATPVSWDQTTGLLQPFSTAHTYEVRVPYVVATSTIATSTLKNTRITGGVEIGGSYFTNLLTFLTSVCSTITGSASLCDGNDASGSGSVASISTSTAETQFRVPFWDSTGATPALLNGGDSTFSYNPTADRLTFTYGSTTGITATNFFGSLIGNANTASALFANGSNCSAGAAAGGVTAAGVAEDCTTYLQNINSLSIDELSDVAAMTENLGDLLYWNGSAWADIATSTLFGSATPGHVLMWNGSQWQPSATATCVQITGSSDLCDGSDATGGAGGASDFVFNSTFGALNAATSSNVRIQGVLNATSSMNISGLASFYDYIDIQGWRVATTTTVCANGCEFTTPASALTAVGSNATIYVKKGSYTISSTLTYPGSGITIQGEGPGVVFNCNAGSVNPCIDFGSGSGMTHNWLNDVKVVNTGAAQTGIGADFNETLVSGMRNVWFDGFATSTSQNDVSDTDLVFYNNFYNVRSTGTKTCFEFGGQANNNNIYDGRCAVVAGGIGFYIASSTHNVTLNNINAEPADGTGSIGVYILDASHNISIKGGHLEENATAIKLGSNTHHITIDNTFLYSTISGAFGICAETGAYAVQVNNVYGTFTNGNTYCGTTNEIVAINPRNTTFLGIGTTTATTTRTRLTLAHAFSDLLAPMMWIVNSGAFASAYMGIGFDNPSGAFPEGVGKIGFTNGAGYAASKFMIHVADAAKALHERFAIDNTGRASANFFTATSTAGANVFPYASTTAISGTTFCISTDCRTAWPVAAGGEWATTSSDYWATQRNFFSTTSASYFSSIGLAWATSSADGYEATLTARTADDLTNNQIDDLSDVAALSETLGDVLYWDGSAWTDIATSSLGLTFSTTSANYWETQQTARTADDLTNNSIENLQDVTDGITENYGDLFFWNGSAWADLATSSLGLNVSALRFDGLNGPLDVRNGVVGATSTIRYQYGGTGLTTLGASSTILISNGTAYVQQLLTDWINSIVSASNWVLTGNWDFGGATGLEIPNGTAPVVDAIGEIALDTSAANGGQLLIGTSTNASFPAVLPLEQPLFSITIGSTTPEFISSGTLPISRWVGNAREITRMECFVKGGTSKVLNITDGTNDTETITCATTNTADSDVSTNATFTANELWYVEHGATTGTVDYVTITAYGYITRQ